MSPLSVQQTLLASDLACQSRSAIVPTGLQRGTKSRGRAAGHAMAWVGLFPAGAGTSNDAGLINATKPHHPHPRIAGPGVAAFGV